MAIITEEGMYKLMLVFLLFLLLAFDPNLARVYMFMIFADFVFWFTDLFRENKKVEVRFERTDKNRLESFITGAVAYGLFLGITVVVFSLFPGTQNLANIQSVITLMATATPILQGSVILTVLAFGVIVPIVETRFFFGRLYEASALVAEKQGFRTPLFKYSRNTLILFAVVAAMFALFHITAKRMENVAMIVTFIFGIVSMILVVKDRELKSAIWFHIDANVIAVLSSLGLLATWGML